MEPGFREVLLKPEGNSKPGSGSPKSLIWLCIPFFLLQRYSSLSTDNPGAFPVQTLMQAQFARNTYRRDMLQAVCQIENVPSDYCFHIAQLWCIVLDNCTSLEACDTEAVLISETQHF
jgi:hypothetical protein